MRVLNSSMAQSGDAHASENQVQQMRAAIKGKRLDEVFGDSLALAIHEQQDVREGTRDLMQVFPLLIRGMPGSTTPVSAAELDHMMPGDLLFFRMGNAAPDTQTAPTGYSKAPVASRLLMPDLPYIRGTVGAWQVLYMSYCERRGPES